MNTKLNSIEEVLAEFDEYYFKSLNRTTGSNMHRYELKAFIRAALTKVQRDTREETIEEVGDLVWEDGYGCASGIPAELLDKLKKKK